MVTGFPTQIIDFKGYQNVAKVTGNRLLQRDPTTGASKRLGLP